MSADACPPWDSARSPVVPHLDRLLGAVRYVAPERAAALQPTLDRVTWCVDDAPGFVFRARGGADPRTIRASVVGLEFLWALSYAHPAIYNAGKDDGAADLDFATRPDTAAAAALLGVAFGDRLGPAPPRCALPAHLPRPHFHEPGAGTPGLVELATELWAYATGWILHHELSHVRLGHLDTAAATARDEQRDEQDADAAATAWMLEGVTDPALAHKRGLGVALAVLALGSLALANRPTPAQLARYPTAGERILRALCDSALGEDGPVHEFACVALKVHFDHRGLALSRGPFDTAYDCLHAYCRALSRFERG